MPDVEDSETQREQLRAHRATLAHLLSQQAQFGAGHIPAHVANGIAAARAGIAHCKTTLRSWGEEVEDHPDDSAPAHWAPAQIGKRGARRVAALAIAIMIGLVLLILVRTWDGATPTATPPPQTAAPTAIALGVAAEPTLSAAAQPALTTVVPLTAGVTSPTTGAGAACPTTISFGTPIQCSLNESGRDVFALDAAEGDQLLIVVARTREVNEGGMEPSFVVSRRGGADVSGCKATNPWYAEAFCAIPRDGVYVLTVSGKPTGHDVYHVFVQRLNGPAHATPITLGVPHTGRITRMAQIDTYTFTVPANLRIAVEVQSNNPNDNPLGPWFVVYQPDGTPAPRCADSDAYHAEASCTLPVAGTYTMLVADGNRQGMEAYTVQVRLVEGP